MSRTTLWVLTTAALLLVFALPLGCVRRTLKITTEPPGALVHLNDQEIGRSPTEVDFTWYGDYDVVVRKEGYETLCTSWNVKAPWYQVIPMDFFAEVLWPGKVHDVHEGHFELTAAEAPTSEELADRAVEFRERAMDTRP
jgi:hypothetical protein